jgi:hypothetical protein
MQMADRRDRMARYLMLWELDRTKIPADPKERAAAWSTLANLVRQDLDDGATKSWGSFVGEMKGYCLVEGDEVDIAMMVQKYTPYVYFKTHPVATIDAVETMLKQMAG